MHFVGRDAEVAALQRIFLKRELLIGAERRKPRASNAGAARTPRFYDFSPRAQDGCRHLLELHYRPALSREREGAPIHVDAFLSPQKFWLPPRLLLPERPFLLKLMPLEDIGKQVHIELRLFPQNPDALPILVAPGLHTDRDQIFCFQLIPVAFSLLVSAQSHTAPRKHPSLAATRYHCGL
jgi:hypothetical protein